MTSTVNYCILGNYYWRWQSMPFLQLVGQPKSAKIGALPTAQATAHCLSNCKRIWLLTEAKSRLILDRTKRMVSFKSIKTCATLQSKIP